MVGLDSERSHNIVALNGVTTECTNPVEYAVHSGRIGGTTRLAVAGLSTLNKREGRWKSDTFMVTFEEQS